MNILPGWQPGFYASRSQVHLTHIDTTTGSSSGSTGAVVHPASGIETGDLLIYVAAAGRTSSADDPEMSAPSGYTTIREASATPGGGAGYRVLEAYKIAAGTEDGTSVQISDGSDAQFERAAILQFRPSTPIGSVTVVDEDLEITSNNPAAQAMGATGTPVNLHVGFYVGSNNTMTSRSYSPTEDAESQIGSPGGAHQSFVKWKLFNPPDTAQEVTVNMDDEGLNILASFMLLCNPA